MTHMIQTVHGAAEGRTQLKFVPSVYMLDVYFTRYFIAPEGKFVSPTAETSCRQSLKDKE